MAKLIDLNKSINDVLKTSFPGVSPLSNDVGDVFSKPCFFTKVIPLKVDFDSVNYSSNKILVVINFFSDSGTEIENLKMYDEIKEAFGMTLKVGRRSFLIYDFRSEIVDEILQTKFNLNYLVDGDRSKNIQDETDYDLMQEINLDWKRRD